MTKAKEFWEWLFKHHLEKHYAVLSQQNINHEMLLEVGWITHDQLQGIGIKPAGDWVRLWCALQPPKEEPPAPSKKYL